MKKPRLLIAVLSLTLLPLQTLAYTSDQFKAVIEDHPLYLPNEAGNCNTATAGGPASIDGHVLPAAKGGSGYEEPVGPEGFLIKPDGSPSLSSSGQKQFVTFSKNASASQAFRDYYITMRWRYAKWNWNGSAISGPEDTAFYSKSPRVLVTNPGDPNDPNDDKSIIAVVLEAGPAPWTGVEGAPDNTPKAGSGWVNPQDGTPAAYRGRVSGFPPVARRYLGYQQRMPDGSGEDLVYTWAEDQSATPGPADGKAEFEDDTQEADCPAAAAAGPEGGIYTGSFLRNTDTMTCPVGEDRGVGTGYAKGKPYKIRLCSVQGITVNTLIAQQLNNLILQARAQSYNFTGGGFRTMEQQIQLRRDNGCPANPNAPSSSCVVPTAPPGWSNHQMGLAIDFSYRPANPNTTPALIRSQSNPGFVWLKQNAAAYGLKNFPAEAWHWSVDGK